MVHRTDVAGSIGCSMGQISPGTDGMCRHAPHGALLEKSHFPEPLSHSCVGGNNGCRLFMTAVPSVHAILCGGPMRR